MTNGSHHKHRSKSCGRVLQEKVVLSCWLQWMVKCKKVTGENEECSLLMNGKMLPKFRCDEDEGPSKLEEGQEHINTKCQKGQKGPYRSRRDSAWISLQAQEATASSWSRSKAGWKDLLCQYSLGRRRAVFKSFVLKSISSSRYNFSLFTELFWCVLEKKFLSRDWQAQDTFVSPNFIQINDVISYWQQHWPWHAKHCVIATRFAWLSRKEKTS